MILPNWFASRPVTLALLIWLPLVKWSLAPGTMRFALFFAGGAALAALAVWKEGDWARARSLLASPLRGVWEGLCGFAALVALAALLLLFPPLQPWLPYWLYDLIALFDPFSVYVAYGMGGTQWTPQALLWSGGGAVAEEWIFRVALFWRWLPAELDPGRDPGRKAGSMGFPAPGVWARLLAVSVYFAALHWPDSPHALAVALLGSLALGGALLWRKNFALISILHLLFNWQSLILA